MQNFFFASPSARESPPPGSEFLRADQTESGCNSRSDSFLISRSFSRNRGASFLCNLSTSSRTAYRSRRLFLNSRRLAHAVAPPFRKKSRLLRLCPCKRGHDASAALPTFCGFAPCGAGDSFCLTLTRQSKPCIACSDFLQSSKRVRVLIASAVLLTIYRFPADSSQTKSP